VIQIARKTGRCADGAERDGGRIYHAVASDMKTPGWEKALCGTAPGRRHGNGWDTQHAPEIPTCARCAKKLATIKAEEAEAEELAAEQDHNYHIAIGDLRGR
jgi:hypothetical protein